MAPLRTSLFSLAAVTVAAGCSTNDLTGPAPTTTAGPVATSQVEQDFDYPTYRMDTLVDEAENFFGQSAAELAEVVDNVFDRQGRPQAFIAGEEVGGAIGVGLTYGRGMLYRPDEDPVEVFWQGPSVGFDFGGDASKVFVLVYDLGPTERIFRRYPGGGGNIYFIGGVGGEAMTNDGVTIVPIRSGVGARAGVSVEYMKITQRRDINPF